MTAKETATPLETARMLQPIFVKGQVSFTLSGNTITLPGQNLSAFGCTGLPWGPLDPKAYLGRKIQISLLVDLKPAPLVIHCDATILRETTILGDHMGLRFHLTPQDRGKFDSLVAGIGFYPTEYLRKYPRIPSDPLLQTFPLRAKISPDRPSGEHTMPVISPSLVADVENLSPNGLLFSTESQIGARFAPAQRILITLEPRGWFPHQVQLLGMICRISEDVNPETRNVLRRFGVKYVRVDEMNRTTYLALLQAILEQIKNKK